MKILVLSDSHGAVSPMEQAVEQTSPDLILHLGDCWRDGCWSCGASVFSCATATPTA